MRYFFDNYLRFLFTPRSGSSWLLLAKLKRSPPLGSGESLYRVERGDLDAHRRCQVCGAAIIFVRWQPAD
jgi:hypothetical protein